MTKLYISLIVLLITISSFSQNVYISEINYTGNNPFIELAAYRENGNGNTQLEGWTLVLYDSNGYRIESIYLKGKLKKGDFYIIENRYFDTKGGGAILHKDKKAIESLSYGSVENFNNFEHIASTTGENSIQRVLDPATNKPMGWTVAPPTQGNPTAQKSLSVTKDQIEDFNIYPNPARNGKISITTKNSLDKNVVIYSILGSVVYNKTVRSNEVINLENLSTGLYLVQVEEDEKVSVRKLLIN